MKRYYLIFSIVAIVLALAGILVSKSIPDQVRQEQTLMSYNQTGQFSYLTYLKPSNLYGPAPQATPPNPEYPLAAVGTIEFTYSFNPVVERAGSIAVDAVMENPGVWQKTISLVSNTSFSGEITLSFSLDPNSLNNLFEAVEKETGVTAASRNLTLEARVSYEGDSFTQSLPLSMDKNLITISNQRSQTLPLGKGTFDYVVNRSIAAVGAQNYPADIVNSVEFTYDFKPSTADSAAISIEAILESPGVWRKSLFLVPNINLSGKPPVAFDLNLDDIQNQFNEIDAETNLTSAPRLVTIKATISQGGEVNVQTLPITLNKGVMTVGGDLKSVQAGGTGTFDYKVDLKPNTIYNTSTLKPPVIFSGEALPPDYDINSTPGAVVETPAVTPIGPGQLAFLKLIDKMDVTFNYGFQSSQPVSGLNTDVDIVATIDTIKYWSKTIPVLHTQRNGSFTLDFPIDMKSYAGLIQTINSETGVSPDSYNISIVANVHTTGQTQSGKIDEVFSPTLKGIINGNVLQWNKDLTTSLPGAIKTVTFMPNPERYLGLPANWAMGLTSVFSGLLIILAGYLFIIYQRNKPAVPSWLEKENVKIRKKYGQRLVEALTPPQAKEIIVLASMEDLIKVADELAKPIIFQASGSMKENQVYFVQDGSTLYRFVVEPFADPRKPAADKVIE